MAAVLQAEGRDEAAVEVTRSLPEQRDQQNLQSTNGG